MQPLTSVRRTLQVIDTTFVVKYEESRNSQQTNKSYQVEVPPIESLPTTEAEVQPIQSLPTVETEVRPIKSLPTTETEVPPIQSIPISEVETIPSYSQPKPPARLYFSPTLLQDDDDEAEESEIIQPILSTVDQNQTNKLNPRRFGQTFLLDNVKSEHINKTQDIENIRPDISDEIPFMIHCDPTILPEKETLNESHHSDIFDHQ